MLENIILPSKKIYIHTSTYSKLFKTLNHLRVKIYIENNQKIKGDAIRVTQNFF